MGVDIYFSFNRKGIPAQEVKNFMNRIQPGLIDRIWIVLNLPDP